MSEPPVLFAKLGSVAVVTLNRPRALNAYNVAMRDALFEVLSAVRDDLDVRAMVLCGNGPSFSTGGDLTEFGTAPSPVAARRVRWQRDVWGTLYRMPKPTIAAVHGYTVGGGLEMALLCDLCVAADDTIFSYPETSLAMIPGVGGTQTTPRLIGLGRALDLILTGRQVGAKEAFDVGLVARVTAPSRLRSEALRLAQQFSQLRPALVAQLKRRVLDGFDRPEGAAG